MLVSLFVGASAGGLLLAQAHIYAPVLPFVITLAAVATAAIVLRERDTADSGSAVRADLTIEGKS